ncbi:hypothetical protein HDU86_002546 [Geranomyces michiganensis]|nr:hypothetical protein HDU86_002546 [Geranomyces michiganensis]
MEGRHSRPHQPSPPPAQQHQPPPLQPPAKPSGDSAAHNDRHVLRVKRKRNADPIDAFIVATGDSAQRKKARTDAEEAVDEPAEPVATVFQRIDTVESSAFDTAIRSQATLDRLRDLRTGRQSPKASRTPSQTAQERREDQISSLQAESKAARYKVVSRQRQLAGGDDISLLDVEEQDDVVRPPKKGPAERFIKEREEAEDDVVSSLMPMVQEYLKVSEGSDYVYDLYYAQTTPLPAANHTRVAELTFDEDPELFMHDRRRGSDSDPDDSDCSNIGDDHDSNAEDYYGNFYPDASDLEGSDSEGEPGYSSSDDDYGHDRDW